MLCIGSPVFLVTLVFTVHHSFYSPNITNFFKDITLFQLPESSKGMSLAEHFNWFLYSDNSGHSRRENRCIKMII